MFIPSTRMGEGQGGGSRAPLSAILRSLPPPLPSPVPGEGVSLRGGTKAMQSTSHLFKDNVAKALVDPNLQQALVHVRTKFIDKRQEAINALPEFESLRDAARDLKNHVLSRLDEYLLQFEENVTRH